MVIATEAAFLNALFVTDNGSIIPASIILTCSPVTAFNPEPSGRLNVELGISIPALVNIVLNGAVIAFNKADSPFVAGNIFLDASKRAIPPPGTIPSLIAALVAQIASSTLSAFSFNSISDPAPTFTTATFADNLANLFSILITSAGGKLASNCDFNSSIKTWTSFFVSPTCNIVSVSLVIAFKQ